MSNSISDSIYSVSVVVPVYNSQDTLAPLVDRLKATLGSITSSFEIVLVNDGSRDQSWVRIEELVGIHQEVHGINLMRNYGQHNALLCGIRAAVFDIVVTIDDDLQHPPEEIPILLGKLSEGYDVVYGKPKELPHSLWRNFMSRFTKRSMAMAMGIKNIQDISAFRCFRADLRDAFASYQSPNLLLDVLLSWGTTRFTAVAVDHHPRLVGKSNYNFIKLFNQALLILTGFSTAPLRVASLVGFSFTLFGLGVLVYVVGRYALQGSVPGFPFLASVVTVFAGAQLFALGIIGEYLARIFNRSIERPTYVVRQQLSGDK